MNDNTFILKALVGSRGYGVYDDDSDHDYRGVYVVPTERILSLGYKYKGTQWIEGDGVGKVDDTAYEIGHFLHLATKCNPTILNTLKAPVMEEDGWGKELRGMFRSFLGAKQCHDAFIGYGVNQRKKMLDNKDSRWYKYGAAYIRQLWYLHELFETGDYNFVLKDPWIIDAVRQIKDRKWSVGKIVDNCAYLMGEIEYAYHPEKWHDQVPAEPDLETVNKWLIGIRRAFLEYEGDYAG